MEKFVPHYTVYPIGENATILILEADTAHQHGFYWCVKLQGVNCFGEFSV